MVRAQSRYPITSYLLTSFIAPSGDFSQERRNRVDSPRLPSPINAMGLGFRRAVKPDVLLAGGRQIYYDTSIGDGSCSCSPVRTSGPPGQRAASPGTVAGELSATR